VLKGGTLPAVGATSVPSPSRAFCDTLRGRPRADRCSTARGDSSWRSAWIEYRATPSRRTACHLAGTGTRLTLISSDAIPERRCHGTGRGAGRRLRGHVRRRTIGHSGLDLDTAVGVRGRSGAIAVLVAGRIRYRSTVRCALLAPHIASKPTIRRLGPRRWQVAADPPGGACASARPRQRMLIVCDPVLISEACAVWSGGIRSSTAARSG
jgi:hypothetical protein